MKKTSFTIYMVLMPTIAFAQTQKTSNALERVSGSLGQCVGHLEQKIDEYATLQKALLDAQLKIKQLEDKSKDKDK